uniref:Serine/threonine-protein kinase receptor n=1 Tax=Rhipicephalus zambeziensis TaxID=60191 RepID=A0A224YKQ4_9ACAR
MTPLRLLVVVPLLAMLIPLAASQKVCAYSRQSSVRLQPSKADTDGHKEQESASQDDYDARRSSGDEHQRHRQQQKQQQQQAQQYQDHEQNLATGELLDSNTTERCPRGSNFCYTLWQEDPTNKTTQIILTQGCWGSSGEVDCKSSDCVSTKKPSKALNNTKFCCCLGDFCNVNVTDGYIPTDDDSTEIYPPEQYRAEPGGQTVVLVIVGCLLLLATTVGLVVFYWRCVSPKPKTGLDSAHLVEAPQLQSPMLDLDSLKIQETIGKGRYGCVCKGSLNDCTVAVKIFAQHHHHYYANEKDIYKLFHGDLPFLPRLIGADERTYPDGRREWMLVLTHVSKGCLQEQLRKTTVDWSGLCRMAQSITRALAYLHTEEPNKPCIAHRDLTSQNILVKDDGSCMLCDFGFAIRISGSKYIQNGEEQHAETNSLADVGTLRYMAPEVLEGAVNLRDCESSLKQVDVYALGLVLWEIATRCSDLYQGMSVPGYKMPFEAEVGAYPSTDQMQVLVARHKARPLFPDIWKDSNPAVRALKETIEDCWDHDAEARLTAVCVEERLTELPVLWERHKAGLSVAGVSPTINATWPQQPRGPPLCLLGGSGGLSASVAMQRDAERSETTTETLLSPSLSSDGGGGQPKNSITNNVVHLPSMQLQPHQGRNPCLERNLMMEPAEEVAISGNTLLEQDTVGRSKGLPPYTQLNEMSTTPITATAEDNSVALALGDLLGGSTRTCHPIPYVQNAVHVSTVIPKQPNLPGNGHKLPATAKKPSERQNHHPFVNIFRKSSTKASNSASNVESRPQRRGLRGLFGRRSWDSNGQAATVTVRKDQGAVRSDLVNAAGWADKLPVNTEVQMMVDRACRVRPVSADAETSPLLQSKDINDNCRAGEEEGRLPRPTTLPLRAYLQPKGTATADSNCVTANRPPSPVRTGGEQLAKPIAPQQQQTCNREA